MGLQVSEFGMLDTEHTFHSAKIGDPNWAERSREVAEEERE